MPIGIRGVNFLSGRIHLTSIFALLLVPREAIRLGIGVSGRMLKPDRDGFAGGTPASSGSAARIEESIRAMRCTCCARRLSALRNGLVQDSARDGITACQTATENGIVILLP